MAWTNNWAVRWFRHNVTEPLIAVMQRGAEPKTLAMSAALGVTLGVFPIYGVTALMCACAIAILGPRCNAPTMLIANLVATPIELSLVVPFLRLGESIVRGKHLLLSKDALWKAVTGRASWDVLLGLWHAFLGWAVAAPFIIGCLYVLLLPLMKIAIKKYGALQSAESHLTPLMKDTDEDEMTE
ncbi:unnamed protein product [Calypogeia fissa]